MAGRVLRLENAALITCEDPLDRCAAATNDKDARERALQITALEMRLSTLAARLSAPKKGDHPDQLSAQYDVLAMQLRELKRQ